MSAKPCDICKIIMVNYANLWLVHSQVVSLLDGARLELKEVKAHSLLLGSCTTYPLLKSNLETSPVEIKDFKHKLDHSSRYTILSPLCEMCGSLKGKLFYATKENTELKQEVTYLTACLEKTKVSEKIIEDDLSRVEESTTKSTYKLCVRFERCEKKDEKNAPKFVQPKEKVKRETLKPREEAFVCMFCGRAGQLDEFCFWHKRIEKRRFKYARNSYRDEFFDFPPRSYSRALPHTSFHACYVDSVT
jgi:hypothetical protein